jgi:hypothetical protein
MSTIREDLNVCSNNILNDDFRKSKLGELLTLLIDSATYTQTAVAVTANVSAALTAVPTAVFQVDATTATVAGIKTLRIGPISGEDAIVPATGEVVWRPGQSQLLFAAADVVTAMSILYSSTLNKASALAGSLESDGGAGIPGTSTP